MIRWDIQGSWNPWFSLGIHFDHKMPYVVLHLPCLVLCIGRQHLPGFRSCPGGFGLRDDEGEADLIAESLDEQRKREAANLTGFPAQYRDLVEGHIDTLGKTIDAMRCVIEELGCDNVEIEGERFKAQIDIKARSGSGDGFER